MKKKLAINLTVSGVISAIIGLSLYLYGKAIVPSLIAFLGIWFILALFGHEFIKSTEEVAEELIQEAED